LIIRLKSLNFVPYIKSNILKNLIYIAFIFSLLLFLGSCTKQEPLVLKNGLAPVSNDKMITSSSPELNNPGVTITDPENEEDKEVSITDPENEEDKEVN
jgi:hypothetical protein